MQEQTELQNSGHIECTLEHQFIISINAIYSLHCFCCAQNKNFISIHVQIYQIKSEKKSN